MGGGTGMCLLHLGITRFLFIICRGIGLVRRI
jgi:hypothetical protein